MIWRYSAISRVPAMRKREGAGGHAGDPLGEPVALLGPDPLGKRSERQSLRGRSCLEAGPVDHAPGAELALGLAHDSSRRHQRASEELIAQRLEEMAAMDLGASGGERRADRGHF